MTELTRRWAGRIFGTNTGNVSVLLEGENDAITGELRLADDQFGPCVYSLSGTFDGSRIDLEGQGVQAPAGIELGDLKITGELSPDGNLKGEWESVLGTGGVFQLFPHSTGAGKRPISPSLEQVNEEQRFFGAVRLYGEELQAVVQELTADFVSPPKIITTYKTDAGTRTLYFDDFLNELRNGTRVSYLKLFAQEPEANGINKIVVLELSAEGANSIRSQSASQSWALGKVEAVARRIEPYEQKLAIGYRRYGIGLVQLLLLGSMIVALPSIDSVYLRIVLLAVTSAVLWVFGRLHTAVLKNFAFYPDERTPNQFVRALPRLFSWLSAILASVIAAYAAYLLGVN